MRSPASIPVALTALAALWPVALGAQTAVAGPSVEALLAAAATYLSQYEQQFSALIAEEQYEQTTKTDKTESFIFVAPARRDLRSDLMVLNLGAAQWVQFRDVYEVDKKPVRDHEARLQKLFEQPSADALSQAQRIADESAHYNVGVSRNINVPTMALAYLTRANQPRSAFAVAGRESVNGAPTAILQFRETAAVSLIQTEGGSVATSGRFWIDPSTGIVRRTELVCQIRRPWALTGTTVVDYGPAPGVPILVPVVMNEQYQHDGELDVGHATYSRFRTFAVDTQAIKRGGGD